jgi:hypothetical protein
MAQNTMNRRKRYGEREREDSRRKKTKMRRIEIIYMDWRDR